MSRGIAVKSFEAGLNEGSVVIEFESVKQALATYERGGYQAALKALSGGAERDVRFLEGIPPAEF